MLLKHNCIYGYYEEGAKLFIANHSSSGDVNSNFGIYLCEKFSNRIEPVYMNYATQINPPFSNCLFNGNFGNIVSLEEFIFIPYYNRVSTDKWDIICKYSKVDLTLLRSKTIQSKGIIQDGGLINQTRDIWFNYDGLWKPILATIDNYLYYLIDDIIFIIEPNELNIVGEITLGDNFLGCSITALSHKGEFWLVVINENEIKFFPANKSGRNVKTIFTADIPIPVEPAAPTSISVSPIDMVEEIPAKVCVYDDTCGEEGS